MEVKVSFKLSYHDKIRKKKRVQPFSGPISQITNWIEKANSKF